VILSVVENTTAFTVEVHVTNETAAAVTLPVEWTVLDTDGAVLASGAEKATVEAQVNSRVLTIDASAEVAARGVREVLVFVTTPDLPEQRAMTAFAPTKHLSLRDPDLSVSRDGDKVTVIATRPSPWVWLDAGEQPIRVSDNFFAMAPGAYTVTLEDAPAPELRVVSLTDTFAIPPAG
jgi:hypothetical protein